MPLPSNQELGNYCKAPYSGFNYCSPAADGTLFEQIILTILGTKIVHEQLNYVIYNIDKLRILWEIASDGITSGNFSSSSDASADKAVINVKSDIIEQYWQSTGDTSEWVQWDAGAGKTIIMDTFALLQHNLTTSAVVKLYGYGTSSDSAPGTWVGVSVYATLTMPEDQDETNLIWSSPALPVSGFRHWRMTIKDSTNADGYLRIGRLVGGASLIFVGDENILDSVEYQLANFKDEFKLNGFNTIANNRAQKKQLRLRFNKLDRISQINYRRLKRYLNYSRDTLKALIVPDPADPYLFTVYAKLKEVPSESHNFVSDENSYVTIELFYDEGR